MGSQGREEDETLFLARLAGSPFTCLRLARSLRMFRSIFAQIHR